MEVIVILILLFGLGTALVGYGIHDSIHKHDNEGPTGDDSPFKSGI